MQIEFFQVISATVCKRRFSVYDYDKGGSYKGKAYAVTLCLPYINGVEGFGVEGFSFYAFALYHAFVLALMLLDKSLNSLSFGISSSGITSSWRQSFF